MKKLYSLFFAKVYDRFMKNIETRLFQYRKNLLSDLKGEVLEVGSGTGVNFKFYSTDINLLSIDPSFAMLNIAKSKVPDNMNVKFLNVGVNDQGFYKHVEDKKFDAIVCTLVLCTIPEPEVTIKFLKDLLNDGGELIVMEHIQHHNKLLARLYNIVNPVWNVIGDGCNLNRHTDEIIKSQGFKTKMIEKEQYFSESIPFYANVFIKA